MASKESGIMALPTVILISGLVIEMLTALAFIVFYLLQSGAGSKNAFLALSAAQSGISDATMRIMRNKSDVDSAGMPYAYALSLDNNRTAGLTICQGYKSVSANCDASNPGHYEITSLGRAGAANKRLRAYVNFNSATGAINTESIQEITL